MVCFAEEGTNKTAWYKISFMWHVQDTEGQEADEWRPEAGGGKNGEWLPMGTGFLWSDRIISELDGSDDGIALWVYRVKNHLLGHWLYNSNFYSMWITTQWNENQRLTCATNTDARIPEKKTQQTRLQQEREG